MRRQSLKVTLLKTIFLVLTALYPLITKGQIIPLVNAFAHNDYFNKRPLFDALDNGFTYIEADVFLKDGKLIVAHINPFFKENRTLENLYLNPLAARVKQNNGQVYKGYSEPLTLMIDIKTNANETYMVLRKLLQNYQDMLTCYNKGTLIPGAVTIVISGNKPYKLINNEVDSRIAFIDADLTQWTQSNSTHHLFPLASCKYSRLLSWKGDGKIPAQQKQRLKSLIAEAHKRGRKVRLWASPENKNVWQELLECGVDLINTDNLTQLKNFLLNDAPVFASNYPVISH